MKRDLTLITGASSGIGAALARVFARHGHDLALTARSRDALEMLAHELAPPGAPAPLVVAEDLARPGAADRIAARIAEAGGRVSTLVNNAGFGLSGPAAELDRAEQLAMVDVNVRALTDLTLCFLPNIVAARGGILNVASTAAFQPGPNMALYYASKAFVLSFSEALSHELEPHGVRVTALCPGATRTGFQDRAGMDAAILDMLQPADAAEVAEHGYRALQNGTAVAIPGMVNSVLARASTLLPHSLSLPLLARLQARRGAKKISGTPPFRRPPVGG
jgi:short-subunit dehydrogenase